MVSVWVMVTPGFEWAPCPEEWGVAEGEPKGEISIPRGRAKAPLAWILGWFYVGQLVCLMIMEDLELILKNKTQIFFKKINCFFY